MIYKASEITAPTINFPTSELYSEEKDAVGTNVGMSSPYLGVESPYGDPFAPTFLTPLMDDLSTSYVNGQRATCELDGVAVSCQRLLATSGDALAVEGRVGTRKHQFAVEKQVGQFRVPIRFTETRVRIGDHEKYGEHIMGATPTAWMVIDVSTYQQVIEYKYPEKEREELYTETKKALEKGDCKKKLNDLLADKKKKFSTKKGLTGVEALIDRFMTGDGYNLLVSNTARVASYGNKTIKFSEHRFKNWSSEQNVLTFLHEIAHAMSGKNQGYSHKALSESIAKLEGLSFIKMNDEYKNLDDGSLEGFSGVLSAWLNEYCGDGKGTWKEIVNKFR